ncbi:MAG TPA: hypothetical protein VMX74_02250 [Pirellulales bacterium]|nr:hypothetical protein [Pirellulales bacterium]
MRRARQDDSDLHEHDSFLDIVANMVGILIILVLLVSIRAKDAPVKTEMPNLPEVDLESAYAAASSWQHDVQQLGTEVVKLDQLLAARTQERQALATMLAAAKDGLKERRAGLNDQQREKFDLDRQLAATRSKLEQIELQRIREAGSEAEVIEVKSFQTPISDKVFGDELHLQLRGSYVAEVPIDELFEEAKEQAREKVWKLDQLSEVTELAGPIRGFRMRYTLEKKELPLSVRLETGRSGHMIRANHWELIPTESQLGEPTEVALAPGSQFRRLVDSLDPKSTTVTVWVYPDSFADFLRLKEQLYHRGFATAARPLPMGVSIAGSPGGSRSNAQ